MAKTLQVINEPFQKSRNYDLEDSYNIYRLHAFEDLTQWFAMIDALKNNKFINAIKITRQETEFGLKEAKEFVENIRVKEMRFLDVRYDLFYDQYPEYMI